MGIRRARKSEQSEPAPRQRSHDEMYEKLCPLDRRRNYADRKANRGKLYKLCSDPQLAAQDLGSEHNFHN